MGFYGVFVLDSFVGVDSGKIKGDVKFGMNCIGLMTQQPFFV